MFKSSKTMKLFFTFVVVVSIVGCSLVEGQSIVARDTKSDLTTKGNDLAKKLDEAITKLTADKKLDEVANLKLEEAILKKLIADLAAATDATAITIQEQILIRLETRVTHQLEAISSGLAAESNNFTTIQQALEDAEKFIEKFNQTYNIPSLVLGLTIKGKSVWQKAWGFADLENYVPAKVDTRYMLASLSKTIASILIGTLVDQGLLHLDDPITRYVNEATYPHKKWDDKPVNITIRQLLSHTSGVRADGAKVWLTTQSAPNVTQALHLFNDDPLHSKPGSGFLYSNLGFELLGAAIESATKKPYQEVFSDFMHKHGLVSSYARNRSILLHNIARTYMSPANGPAKENVPALLDELAYVKAYWPAGGIISNVPDLIGYGQLLVDSYKGRAKGTNAISQATLKQLWTTHVRNLPTQVVFHLHYDYALGWFAASGNANLKHGHIFGHQGAGLGCSTMLLIYPDEEIVAVALTNKGGITKLDQVITHIVENVYPLVK